MTRRIYYSVWKQFNEFFIRLDDKPNNWEQRITLFVGYLIEQNKQSQTVHSYVSAIWAVLAEINTVLNEDLFLLSALTRACKFKNDRASMRLPIRKSMFGVLLHETHDWFYQQGQPYLAALYCALFSTAYFGLFRVGEVTQGSHLVMVTDVHLAKNKNKILFVLHTSKTHGLHNRPQSIKITFTGKTDINQKKGKREIMCPYQLFRTYIQHRPCYLCQKEPFFVFADNSSVKPIHM